MTDCERLQTWLDAMRPAAEAAEHEAHAASCARCRKVLAAMEEIEAALRAVPNARAPGWVTAAVMRQVEAAPQRLAPPPALASPRALAWWTGAGLTIGAAGWIAMALPNASVAVSLPYAPDVPAALATVSLVVAAGLTWASLRLVWVVRVAAL